MNEKSEPNVLIAMIGSYLLEINLTIDFIRLTFVKEHDGVEIVFKLSTNSHVTKAIPETIDCESKNPHDLQYIYESLGKCIIKIKEISQYIYIIELEDNINLYLTEPFRECYSENFGVITENWPSVGETSSSFF